MVTVLEKLELEELELAIMKISFINPMLIKKRKRRNQIVSPKILLKRKEIVPPKTLLKRKEIVSPKTPLKRKEIVPPKTLSEFLKNLKSRKTPENLHEKTEPHRR